MKKISVWASGNGSNAENIIHYFEHHSKISIEHIVCNNPQAGVIERALRLNKPCFVLPRKSFIEGNEIVQLFREKEIDFVVLAGFLQMVTSEIIQCYPEAIINIHPALLPRYGGKGMYGHHVHEAVIAAGEKESGITVHLVDEVYDHGKIILQKTCPVLEGDDADTLAERIHALEHQWYPKAIEDYILENKI